MEKSEIIMSNVNERWKDIAGYGGKFQVSNTGKIMNTSTKQPCELKRKSEMEAHFYYCDEIKIHYVKNLVALYFLPKSENPEEKYVNHLDGDKYNNVVGNLKWVAVHDLIIEIEDNDFPKKQKLIVKRNDNDVVEQRLIVKRNDIGVWKDIEGYDGKYQISNTGRVINTQTNQFYETSNRTELKLYKNGSGTTLSIKVLVATHFLPKNEDPNKKYVINKDGNKNNNNVENLLWCETRRLFLKNRVAVPEVLKDDKIPEEWKKMDESSFHEISNYGIVRIISTSEIINCMRRDTNNIYIMLKEQMFQVSRLTAKYFVPNPDDKPEISYIDGNKLNNRYDNLLWINYGEVTDDQRNSLLMKLNAVDPNNDDHESTEMWKLIVDYPNYVVSNLGNIRHVLDNKNLVQTEVKCYYAVGLSKGGVSKTTHVHKIVAKTFVDVPDNLKNIKKLYIDHIDNNKLNNKALNLRWGTQSNNINSFNQNFKVDPKKVLQFDLQENLIKEWANVGEILKTHPDFSNKSIRLACRGANKTAHGYIWKYKDPQKKQQEAVLNEDEVFKNCGTIDGYNFSEYEVSNYGQVCSLKNAKNPIVMKHNISGDYDTILLHASKKEHRYQIHTLVATVFIENPNKYDMVNHKDENKRNNHYKNLEWCTSTYNNKYSFGKAVEMIDKDTGKVLKTFATMSEAIEYLGKTKSSSSGISSCCNGKQQIAYGYKWRFVNNNVGDMNDNTDENVNVNDNTNDNTDKNENVNDNTDENANNGLDESLSDYSIDDDITDDADENDL